MIFRDAPESRNAPYPHLHGPLQDSFRLAIAPGGCRACKLPLDAVSHAQLRKSVMPWIPLKVFAVIPMGRLYRAGAFPQYLFRKTRGGIRRLTGHNKSVKLPDKVKKSQPHCKQKKRTLQLL